MNLDVLINEHGQLPCYKYLRDKVRAVELITALYEGKVPRVLFIHEACFMSDPWDEAEQDKMFETIMKDFTVDLPPEKMN